MADFLSTPIIESRPDDPSQDRTMVLNMGPQHPVDARRVCGWCWRLTARR